MSRFRKLRNQRRHILDFVSVEDIPKSKHHFKQLLKYQWECYSELAFKRAQIYESLKTSLREECTPFKFNTWQRAVKYKYSLTPLSTQGSLTDPGGRFNMGEIDSTRFQLFPALYVASSKTTALDELFARDKQGRLIKSFDALSLTRAASTTIVSVSGNLESTLDLRDLKNLKKFVDLIKDFTFSATLLKEAKKLNVQPSKLVKSVQELSNVLMESNWRIMPMQWDVPAPSQIFGQIVADAGIEGIVYSSVLTKQPCLAIYPQNFNNSSSFIEIDDLPPSEIVQRRIDSKTFSKFI